MTLSGNGDLLRSLFDAIPSFVFVVDEDVRLIECNAAAASLLPDGWDQSQLLRGGEALQCLHALDVPEGCGRGPRCRDCRIRNAVRAAFEGASIARCRARLQFRRNGESREMHALVTATPLAFQGGRFAILVIEDISELMELRRIVPICCVCKKIRDDKNFWTMVEFYLAQHLDVDLSHGLCPDCFSEEMKRLDAQGPSPPSSRE